MDQGAIVVDDAYVISDLHLGGEAPFQMFCEGSALSGFIRSLLPVAGPVPRRALVINGDFVDFLAERPSRHFDADGAVKKLQRIALDPAFADVFAALSEFLAVPGYRLAIVLGNHDIELALPWVREALRIILCGVDEASAGRIAWSLDGEGLLMRVGTAAGPRILCVHGNEVDPWNVVEHETLRRMARDGLRDQPIDAQYRPNAGSRMVIDVMNGIKQRYPFVDLLKPETAAVIPILLALDPKAAAALMALPALVAQQQFARVRIAAGLLGDETPVGVPFAAGSSPIGPTPRGLLPRGVHAAARLNTGSYMLDLAETNLAGGHAAVDLLDEANGMRTLGLGDAFVTWATGGDRVETLRAQLKELADDRSFSTLDRDATFRDMDARVSTNIDFLVTGHTHLARAIEREFGRSYYFNTGTWARVFHLDPAALADPVQFRALYDALGGIGMGSLDAAPGLVKVRPHVAAFWQDGTGVHGELREVPATAPFGAVRVQGTTYSRS